MPGRLKLRMSKGFRKIPGMAQKLLVAMFRTKRDRLTAWGTWYQVKDENRKENHLSYFVSSPKGKILQHKKIESILLK